MPIGPDPDLMLVDLLRSAEPLPAATGSAVALRPVHGGRAAS